MLASPFPHGAIGAISGYRGGDPKDGGGQAGAEGRLGGRPAPRDQEIISFTDFHRLGLGLTLHPFLRGLLFFYGLRLHDLTPKGILHIMTFITLCEAFLGIAPHFVLWRWVF